MAFPSVVAADTQSGSQTSNATSWTLTYPTNLVSGDLILAMISTDGDQSGNATFPADWLPITFANQGTETLIWGKKKSDGTETGNFTVTLTDSEQGVWRVVRITDWEGTLGTTWNSDTTTGSVAMVLSEASGSSTAPDPGECDPTVVQIGWPGNEDVLWVALAGSDHGNTTYTGFPANYTQEDHSTSGGHNQESGGAGGAAMGVAYRKLNTAAGENPGAFTTDANEGWHAVAFAIRPAAAAAPRVPYVNRMPQLIAQ